MSTLVAQTISNGTVSTSSQNVISGSARAWVCYQNAGSIIGSYNVSSVTQNSTGYFTLNFTNAMPNANYCWTQSTTSPGAGAPTLAELTGRTTTSLPFRSGYLYTGGWADYSSFNYNGIAVFSS